MKLSYSPVYTKNSSNNITTIIYYLGIKMRIRNFKAIDGAGGLLHYTKQSKTIFNEYKNVSQENHRNVVNKILEK